jgi:hypothetical protein
MVIFHSYVSLPEGKTSRVGLQFDGLWEMYSDSAAEKVTRWCRFGLQAAQHRVPGTYSPSPDKLGLAGTLGTCANIIQLWPFISLFVDEIPLFYAWNSDLSGSFPRLIHKSLCQWFTSFHIPISTPVISPFSAPWYLLLCQKRAPQNPVISLDVRYMKSQNNKFWGEIPHFQTPVAPFEVCARADSQKSHYESSRGSCVTRLQWWEICVVMGTPKSSKNWLV